MRRFDQALTEEEEPWSKSLHAHWIALIAVATKVASLTSIIDPNVLLNTGVAFQGGGGIGYRRHFERGGPNSMDNLNSMS